MPQPLDLDIQPADVARLTSPDAVAAFLARLGYSTAARKPVAPAGLSLGDTERQVTHLEMLSEDAHKELRVVFARLKSVTAKARGDLVRAFGRDAVTEHLLILTSDFESIEFVLIEKERRERRGSPGDVLTTPKARVFVVPRRWPEQTLRILRRLTYTMNDGLQQYDKLLSVFDAAHFSGTYFQNRALFADHFLETRLRDDAAWKVDPGPAFVTIQRLLSAAPDRLRAKSLQWAKQELFDQCWSVLGFAAASITRADGEMTADYRLSDSSGAARTVALVYPWARWLDGPDPHDPDRPAENPGAAVVSRDYAREVEQELKRRVFFDVVPMLASGFLQDRRARLKKLAHPTEEELEDIRAATLMSEPLPY
jgi:hypothetical protein